MRDYTGHEVRAGSPGTVAGLAAALQRDWVQLVPSLASWPQLFPSARRMKSTRFSARVAASLQLARLGDWATEQPS